jgi:hypothetical protein
MPDDRAENQLLERTQALPMLVKKIVRAIE